MEVKAGSKNLDNVQMKPHICWQRPASFHCVPLLARAGSSQKATPESNIWRKFTFRNTCSVQVVAKMICLSIKPKEMFGATFDEIGWKRVHHSPTLLPYPTFSGPLIPVKVKTEK